MSGDRTSTLGIKLENAVRSPGSVINFAGLSTRDISNFKKLLSNFKKRIVAVESSCEASADLSPNQSEQYDAL